VGGSFEHFISRCLQHPRVVGVAGERAQCEDRKCAGRNRCNRRDAAISA
jgi:hypothetical protein